MKKLLSLFLVLALLLSMVGCFTQADPGQSSTSSTGSTAASTQPTTTAPTTTAPTQSSSSDTEDKLDPAAFYYSKEDVALFIHQYGTLPANFVTKSEAKSQFGGNQQAMVAGYRIGGDTFQNREGLLPTKAGRTYTECDIVRQGISTRGSNRIVFSNDGLVYYTSDHYRSFTLLYGEP